MEIAISFSYNLPAGPLEILEIIFGLVVVQRVTLDEDNFSIESDILEELVSRQMTYR